MPCGELLPLNVLTVYRADVRFGSKAERLALSISCPKGIQKRTCHAERALPSKPVASALRLCSSAPSGGP